MYKVKIYGAGSIGNHLARASRSMGWEVTISDVDEAAGKKNIFMLICLELFHRNFIFNTTEDWTSMLTDKGKHALLSA